MFWAGHRAQIRYQETKLDRVVGLVAIGVLQRLGLVSLCCVAAALTRLTWV